MTSQINVISTSTIKIPPPPQTESSPPPSTVNLTPWDLELLFLEYSQKGLLYHKPTPQHETAILQKSGAATLIHHLKASLDRTLHFFPPLTGHLVAAVSEDGTATSFSVNCRHAEGGALFVHATPVDTSLTVADVSSDWVPRIVRDFFPLTGIPNIDGVSQPLLAVQVTELADGFFIGLSFNHMLVDGTSFWNFVNSWAEISRGIAIDGSISRPPLLSRDQINLDFLGSRNINIRNEHFNNPVEDQISPSPYPCIVRDRAFHFTKKSMANLKSRANQELITSEVGDKIIISSLQAVIAHVWRSIIRCHFTNDEETTTFIIPMGARQRLNPPLPDEYFGNAVFPGIVTINQQEMLENGLGWTAWQINRMVGSNNGPEKVKDFYTGWVKNPEFLRFDELPSNHFILINSPRFDVYGNNFGWGNPVAARGGGANRFDGRITVNGGLEEGSIEIEACLSEETLIALAEDAKFMDFVTSN